MLLLTNKMEAAIPFKVLNLVKYSKLFSNLLQQQVCARCVLRINNSLDLDLYRSRVKTGSKS